STPRPPRLLPPPPTTSIYPLSLHDALPILADIDGDAILAKTESLYQDYDPDTIDGVKIDFEDGWVHLRKSNTEPIIRVYSEGITAQKAKELAEKVVREIQ